MWSLLVDYWFSIFNGGNIEYTSGRENLVYYVRMAKLYFCNKNGIMGVYGLNLVTFSDKTVHKFSSLKVYLDKNFYPTLSSLI